MTAGAAGDGERVAICEPGGTGMILPFTQKEHDLPDALRAIFYGFLMIYAFIGMAIVSDMFMASIERITSRRRKVHGHCGKIVTQKVWNETVATLTLMALGSSAPEICLSVVEILKKGFHVGQLGPSTIVGSGSFNLLVIVAVCIYAIPDGEIRLIKELPVFYITAIFSVVAYLYLVFILSYSSKDIVEVWEAAVMLLMLPVFVYVAYKVHITENKSLRRALGDISVDEPDNKEPGGMIQFGMDWISVARPEGEDYTLEVVVQRVGESYGAVTLNFKTEAYSAVPGFDYEELEGELEFGEKETEVHLQLTIHPTTMQYKKPREFLLIVEGGDGVVEYNPNDDGGSDAAILTISLQPRDGWEPCWLARFICSDSMRRGFRDWHEMLSALFYCNGSWEEQQEATAFDWACHVISMPWRVFFIVVPPPSFCEGWPTFVAALATITLITAVISDMAELFGCVLGVPDIVTAVSFVALGTSMPDLFASLTAAREDPTADASVVNVTGSNAVNVFLGLGLPWTMATIYWAAVGREGDWADRYPGIAAGLPSSDAVLVVSSDELGFQVLIFSELGAAALFILLLRRRVIGGELGGPWDVKIATSVCFFVFWALYIATTGWHVLRLGKATASEMSGILSATAIVQGLAMVVPIFFLFRHWQRTQRDKSKEAAALQLKQAQAGELYPTSIGRYDEEPAAVKVPQANLAVPPILPPLPEDLETCYTDNSLPRVAPSPVRSFLLTKEDNIMFEEDEDQPVFEGLAPSVPRTVKPFSQQHPNYGSEVSQNTE